MTGIAPIVLPGVMHGIMHGKRGLIMGVANDHSIAWGVASALAAQGAELGFTYQGDAFERRVRPLADSVGSSLGMDAEIRDRRPSRTDS